MPVQIVIARKGDNRFLQQWGEEEESFLDEEISSLKEDEWERAAQWWPKGLLTDSENPPEVFLCLERESLAENYETDLLGKVIRKAHASMWGAKIYVVVDKRLQIEEQLHLNDIRRKWFETLLKNGVSDVLELNVDLVSESFFYQAALRAEARLEILNRHIPSGSWKCMVQNRSPHAELFLGDFSADSLSEDSDNHLIALRDCTDSRIKFVADGLKKRPTGKLLVGLLDAVDTSLSKEFEDARKTKQRRMLERLCIDHHSRLISFQGLFELHYFLQRLDAVHQRHKTILKHSEIVSVQEARFSPHAPQLLITHSFQPGDPALTLAAAGNAGILRRELGDKFEIVVHPAMQSKGFRDTLKRLRQLLVWVHIGHGDDEKGLQQADGLFKNPEEWLSCFASYDKSLSLSLAVFHSCESDTVAREFAGAGVSQAVGFRKKVPKDICREMVVEIVKAAFESSGNRDKIIDAFQRAKGSCGAAEPVIFCARH